MEKTAIRSIFDVELFSHDIQSLSSADALALFFTRLGYNLGLSEAVARPVKRIELLARNDLLQVYLFELKSVTVASIRSLAGAFRRGSTDHALPGRTPTVRMDADQAPQSSFLFRSYQLRPVGPEQLNKPANHGKRSTPFAFNGMCDVVRCPL